MDELERKLRSVLTEMAAEVPPSHNAWAEQERRLARHERWSRRPALMAAVAAAVVALVAIPVLVINLRSDTVQSADMPSSETSAPSEAPAGTEPTQVPGDSVEYRTQPGETLLTQPVRLLSTSVNSEIKSIWGYTVRRDNGERFLCSSAPLPHDAAVIDGASPAKSCIQLSEPRNGKFVWLRYRVPGIGDSNMYVYVASHPTDNILVRSSAGYTRAAKVAECPDFSVFVGMYAANEPPVAFTARDNANATLENG